MTRAAFCIAIAAMMMAGVPGSVALQSSRRVVRMEITVPKDIPPMRIVGREGETVTVALDDLGKFGFEPSFREGDDATVIVTVSDMSSSPSRQFGQVKVPVDGSRVQSRTSPDFGIRIIRVVQPE